MYCCSVRAKTFLLSVVEVLMGLMFSVTTQGHSCRESRFIVTGQHGLSSKFMIVELGTFQQGCWYDMALLMYV